MKGNERAREALKKLGQYKYVFLVALVGALLLIWPTPDKGEAVPVSSGPADSLFDSRTMEAQLERALSKIEGAGEVSVILTLESGPRRVLARDGNAQESQTVTVSKGAGNEEPVELQSVGPTYRGALVVAQGGDDPQVRLELSMAVSALTGLGADRITVCKGK